MKYINFIIAKKLLDKWLGFKKIIQTVNTRLLQCFSSLISSQFCLQNILFTKHFVKQFFVLSLNPTC